MDDAGVVGWGVWGGRSGASGIVVVVVAVVQWTPWLQAVAFGGDTAVQQTVLLGGGWPCNRQHAHMQRCLGGAQRCFGCCCRGSGGSATNDMMEVVGERGRCGG